VTPLDTLQRSGRPGEAVAPLETPQRSSRPGEAVAPLDHSGSRQTRPCGGSSVSVNCGSAIDSPRS
jgi:hypothetical protein